jgi:DMSO reductase family type II enzyme heme b subunit
MLRVEWLVIAGLFGIALGAQARAEPKLQAAKTDVPAKVDGSSNDAVWKTATELKLDAEGRGGDAKGKKATVTLKAAYDNENVYFLLRWQDSTNDETHKSFVWNDAKGAYETGPDREDNAALSFPIKGTFTANMLSGQDELWDVWHWKAQRTGPAGYAMDRTHVFATTEPPGGKAKKYAAQNGKDIWIARPEDAGESVTKESSAPSTKQASAPKHYEAVKPSGSAADIRTGHGYSDGWWTVEFARKLNTGSPDDVVLDAAKTISMGVAVFDKSEHENHYTAGPITLSFTP